LLKHKGILESEFIKLRERKKSQFFLVANAPKSANARRNAEPQQESLEVAGVLPLLAR
jgi:hypothetical protein